MGPQDPGPAGLIVRTISGVLSAFAHAEMWVVHNDGPRWREWIAADSFRMRRKVVVDGRRILQRGAMKGVEQRTSHACRLANQE